LFQYGGLTVGPFDLLDASAFGIAFTVPRDFKLPRGAHLDDFRIQLDAETIWTGQGVVARLGEARSHASMGVSLVSGLLDLEALRRKHPHRADLAGRRAFAAFQTQMQTLSPKWRAAVAELRATLVALREHLNAVDGDPQCQRRLFSESAESILFDQVFETWGKHILAQLDGLYEASRSLADTVVPLARAHATTQLMPLLRECPLQRRAYEKPLGYAGDYLLMEGYCAESRDAPTLFGRFLSFLSHRYSLARALVLREQLLREAVRRAAMEPGDGPVRIVSLACGPGVELRRFLAEVHELPRPLELVLIDQDRDALQHCHRKLGEVLVGMHQSRLPVHVNCLQLSVRQLLDPRDPHEADPIASLLGSAHLIYATGLYDYLSQPAAERLTARLYSLLQSNGRLVIGNFKVAPGSTWIGDFVLAWQLIYRTPDEMLALARRLDPEPTNVEIREDATGYCMLLDVLHPEASYPALATAI
jgi:hypothetical protein